MILRIVVIETIELPHRFFYSSGIPHALIHLDAIQEIAPRVVNESCCTAALPENEK